jgi:uncharacterized protein (TIGR00251 family)
LRIKVVPKATKNEVVGWVGDTLKIRVTAPPERGKANDAVLETISLTLGLPRRNVHLIAGATGERKTVEINGLSEVELRARLQRFFAAIGKH